MSGIAPKRITLKNRLLAIVAALSLAVGTAGISAVPARAAGGFIATPKVMFGVQ